MKEEHIEESSRFRGVDSRKRRFDLIDFPGVLLAIIVLKKSEKLKTLSVCYNHLFVCPVLHVENFQSKKQIFFLFSKKETLLVQNFNLTSPFENT